MFFMICDFFHFFTHTYVHTFVFPFIQDIYPYTLMYVANYDTWAKAHNILYIFNQLLCFSCLQYRFVCGGVNN